MVHWELTSNGSWVVFLEPSRVDELEKIQVERSSQSQTDAFETERRQLIFYFFFLQCLTPAGSNADRDNVGGDINKKRERERHDGWFELPFYTGLPRSFCPFSSTNPSTNPLQARAIKSPRWALLGR